MKPSLILFLHSSFFTLMYLYPDTDLYTLINVKITRMCILFPGVEGKSPGARVSIIFISVSLRSGILFPCIITKSHDVAASNDTK